MRGKKLGTETSKVKRIAYIYKLANETDDAPFFSYKMREIMAFYNAFALPILNAPTQDFNATPLLLWWKSHHSIICYLGGKPPFFAQHIHFSDKC